MDTKEIKLKYSIPIPKKDGGEVKTNELTMGRLKVKHLKLLPDGFMESEENAKKINPLEFIPIIAGLTNIPVQSAEEIDVDDLFSIVETLVDFLDIAPETGKTQS